jgi:hypothetical protein
MNRVFYKFRRHQNSEDLARTLNILAEQKIYAAKLNELNDPCEGNFSMVSGCDDDRITDEVLRNNIRIVSLCRFYSNALLWSYYAEAYSGVCIALSFPEDQPEPVIYGSPYHEIAIDRDKTGNAGVAQRHARRKLGYWKHEVEYRIIKLAESTNEKLFIPCKVEGVLFGDRTPKDVISAIKHTGKTADTNFFSDTVHIDPGWNHPCLGSGLGVRASMQNKPSWLNDGANPLTARPQEDYCKVCNEPDRGDSHDGFLLEEHLLKSVDDPTYYHEEHTILLCPNCHRKAHLNPGWLQDALKKNSNH